MATDRELVQAEVDVVTSLPDSSTPPRLNVSAVAEIEKHIQAYRQVVTSSIRLTSPQDWIAQNGKPYLQSSGAEKIASPFQVSMSAITRERVEREDSRGRWYMYVYEGTFTSRLLGRNLRAIGTCSSRDVFFGQMSHYEGEGSERKKIMALKPMEDVEEPDIMKSAYTNMYNNGIQRLLGIRNLTWEQLADGGIDQTRVGAVEYKSGNKGGTGGTKTVSEGQVKLILARCSAAKLDPKHLLDHLEVLKLPRDVSAIPMASVDEVLRWIETAGKEPRF